MNKHLPWLVLIAISVISVTGASYIGAEMTDSKTVWPLAASLAALFTALILALCWVCDHFEDQE